MNAREVALRVVRDVFPNAPEPGRAAQAALDYRARDAHLDARDRAFATELSYGAIKMRRTLDWYLEPFIGERPQPPPPAIHEILRLAMYELIFTRADEHATVFEFVNLAKQYGHRGVANLVNAILRSFLRDRPPEPAPEMFDSDDEYLGVAYSLPTWLVKQWRATFDAPTVVAICAGVNSPAASAITVNPHMGDRSALLARLAERSITARPSAFVPESILIEDGAYPRQHERAAAGAWWVQSESSAMAADILGTQPGEAVLDLCSGRGNKALQIGATLGGEGSLLCVEKDSRKATLLQERLAQACIVAEFVIGDATAALLGSTQRFDRVLLDTPCSNVGVVGRHPEARWKKKPNDGERLAVTQSALLERVAKHLHPGGTLVYAACSTDPRETSDIIETFLASWPFQRGLIPSAYEPFLTMAGDVLVPPGLDRRDGFYIARLVRVG